MSAEEQRGMRNVFVATDLGPGSQDAVALGVRMALATHGVAQISHVHAPGGTVDWRSLPTVRELLVGWGRLSPGADLEEYRRLSLSVELHAIASLDLVEPLAHVIAGAEPDLVVLPTAGRSGFARLREASVAEAIARAIEVPVLFLPKDTPSFVDAETGTISLRRVLIPVGRPDDARTAIAAAIALVEAFDAAPTEFVLVHVGDASTQPALMLPEDDVRWTWRLDVRGGSLDTEVVAAARAHDVDLIVMTTHGHDSFADGLRGSHTEVVVRHAPVPVLAVPSGR